MKSLKLALISACLCAPALSSAGDLGSVIFPDTPYPLRITLSPGAKTGDIVYQSPLGRPAGSDYDAVFMQGEMPDPGVKLEIWVKSRSIFKVYDQYRESSFRRFPNGRFWARFNVAPARKPLRLVIRADGAKNVQVLTVYELEAVASAALKETDDSAEEPSQPGAGPQDDAPFTVEGTVPFALVRREAWKAAPPKEPYARHVPRAFTLHHTAGYLPKTYQESVAEIQFIQDYHQNGKDWNDIGYHFVIDPLGNIFEGRPMYAVGAHVLNRNTDNIGISFMGNFHPPAPDVPAEAPLRSAAQVGAFLKTGYSIAVSSFHAHREIGATDCPGDLLYAKMPLLKRLIFSPARPAELDRGSFLTEPRECGEAPSALGQLRTCK